MNIESTTVPVTKTAEISTSSSSSGAAAKDSTKTFQNELETVKTQETQNSQTDAEKNANAKAVNTEANAKNNTAQQAEKDKTTQNFKFSDPLNELNSKIAALNEIKNGFNSKSHEASASSKTDTKTTDYSQKIKMDKNDATFFLNLVQNQQMSVQANQQITSGTGHNSSTDIQSEATQSTVQVSATLLNALNESAKTGKSFRIDFDNNIAVIMKVDKEGVLSANFIPGSAAVEQYLKNNIDALRQSFDEQNLPYNNLSYSNQQKQEQKEQQNKNKENGNE